AGSPTDSPACAPRLPHLHPAQTASSRHSATVRPPDMVCASVPPLCSARLGAGGDEAWRQTGFTPEMDVHVRGENIVYHEPFTSAGLVKHLVGRRHNGCAVLHGGEMKLMAAHRSPSSQ